MTDDTGLFAPWEANFRHNMRRIRELEGWTQTDLARRLKQRGLPFHQQTIQRVEAGSRPVRLDEAFVIAEVMDTNIESMTARSAMDLEFTRHVIDGLIRRTQRVQDVVVEAFTEDWISEVEQLALEVLERIKEDDPRQRPSLYWVAAWAQKAMNVWVDLGELLESMSDLTTTSTGPNWRDHHEKLSSPALEDLRDMLEESTDFWRDVPEDNRPSLMSDQAPKDLYEKMPKDVNDGIDQKKV